MKELALHILDIVQNSIRAKASLIEIRIVEDLQKNLLSIQIIDNGIGMNKETLKKVSDPFWTSRNTRKVGLGISLLKAATEMCDGCFKINSQLGKGTEVIAEFKWDHIDRAPLGDMPETISLLIMTNESIDFIYTHTFNQKVYELNTIEIKEVLGNLVINNLEVIDWIKNNIRQGLDEIEWKESR